METFNVKALKEYGSQNSSMDNDSDAFIVIDDNDEDSIKSKNESNISNHLICKKCHKIINFPTKGESKYEICTVCGMNSFPQKSQVKIGDECIVKIIHGQNEGRTVKGKIKEFVTLGDWHYEGLMVILDNDVKGRLKELIISKPSSSITKTKTTMEKTHENSISKKSVWSLEGEQEIIHLIQASKNNEALAYCNEYLENYPKSQSLIEYKIKILDNLEELGKILPLYDKLSELKPTSRYWHLKCKAEILIEMKLFPEAVQLCEESLRLKFKDYTLKTKILAQSYIDNPEIEKMENTISVKTTMPHIKIISSNIESAGYDETKKILEIMFIGNRVYQYSGVPKELVSDFMKADSKGKFAIKYINYNFPYKELVDWDKKIMDNKKFEKQKQVWIKNEYGKEEVSTTKNVEKINKMISDSMNLIINTKNGILKSEIQRILSISNEEIKILIPKLTRIENIVANNVEIINSNEYSNDIKFKFIENENKITPQTEITDKKESEKDNEIIQITHKMIEEYNANKYSRNKYLKQKLTKEFVKGKSILEICKSNPEYTKKMILNHIITDLRLPKGLKKMENEQYFDSDIEISLAIPLFAVNYYQWEGERKDEQKVIELAIAIKKCLMNNRKLREKLVG